jgi:hypothetical protein
MNADTTPTASRTEAEWREAEALAVWQQHGDWAPVHIAQRIGAHAIKRDQGGVDRWKDIARALDRLMRADRC